MFSCQNEDIAIEKEAEGVCVCVCGGGGGQKAMWWLRVGTTMHLILQYAFLRKKTTWICNKTLKRSTNCDLAEQKET